MLDPANDDSALLTLERQFNEVAADLFAVQRAKDELVACSVSRSSESRSELLRPEYSEEVRTRQVETILARLAPIERAIMATPARTIAGLGVKARHVAYVGSKVGSSPDRSNLRGCPHAVALSQPKSRRVVTSCTSCFKRPSIKE